MNAGRSLALSSLVVIAILALGDVLLVPMAALRRSGFDLLVMFALSAKSHVLLLAPLLGVQAALVLGPSLVEKRPALARWVPTLAMVAGLVCAFRSYLVLVEYEQFHGYLPFIAAWLALAVFLAAAYRMMGTGRMTGTGVRRSLPLVLAAMGLAGAVATAWANVRMYPGAYPTLHRSLTTVTYLLGHTAIALVLSNRPHRSVRLSVWGPVALAAVLGVATVASSLASARAVMLSRNFTILGRASVIDEQGATEPCVSPPARLAAQEAREVFTRYSQMPPLPPTFRLTDYNVLLVTIDSLRYDDSSLSGRAGGTPTLVRMVERGAVTFHDAMSPSSGTTQSVSSLLAQTYPTHTPFVLLAPRTKGALLAAARTVPEIFQASGYTTFAGLHGAVPWVLRGVEQGVDLVWSPPKYDETLTSDQELADWTIEALDRAKASGKRFFGWVFLVGPHFPYLERGAPTPSVRDRYRQEVDHTDAQLGRIYDHLQALGQLDTTIVIVMGDHGEEFQEHGSEQHSLTLHDESIHIPVVVLLPPGIKGSRITGVTSALYVFPWLLLTGDARMAAAAERVITDDLAPMMKATDGAVVAELMGVDGRLSALIWPDRKIIHGAYSNYVQMYDRRVDRGEQDDLALAGFPYTRELDALSRYHAVRVCHQRASQMTQTYRPPPNTTRREDVRIR